MASHSFELSTSTVTQSEVDTKNTEKESKTENNRMCFEYSKKQLPTIIIFGFANLFSCTIYSLQAPFYPKEAESKGATATEYGFVLGVFQLVVFIMSPVFGSMLGSVNLKLVFNLGIFVTSACTILFGFLDYIDYHVTFIALSFVLRILQGCGDAAFVTTTFAIISTEFPDTIATTFATFQTCSGIGLIIGPSLGGVLYQFGGFILPFLFMGGCLFTVAIIAYFVLPTVVEERNRGDNFREGNKDSGKSGVLSMISIPTVFLGFFSLFISSSSNGFLVATLEPHMRENFGLSAALTGLIFMTDGVVYTVFAPIWGKLCDRSNEIKIFTIIGAFLSFTGFLFIGPAPFIPLPTLLWLSCVGVIVHSLGLGATFVSSFLLALKGSVSNGFSEGPSTSGLVSGLYSSSCALGFFVGPSVGGVLLDNYGFKMSSLFVLVMQAIVIFLATAFFCTPKKPESKTPQQSENECTI